MSSHVIRPSRKAATATSLAALSHAGASPPVRPAAYARSRHRKVARSGSSNVNGPTDAQSIAPYATGNLDGQAIAYPIGSRISGRDNCAIVDPSLHSTIECTTDWGCTTTSI